MITSEYGEEEIRQICGRIVASNAESEDSRLLADEQLAEEVSRRLSACGMRLVRGEEPIAVIDCLDGELSDLSLAALAICAMTLQSQNKNAPRPRLPIKDLASRLEGEHDPTYLRRAVIGPLEVRGMIRLIKPGQRVGDAYLVAGPALAAIDGEMVKARLKELVA